MPRGPADPVTCHVVTGLAGRGTTAFLRVVLTFPALRDPDCDCGIGTNSSRVPSVG